MPNQSANPLLAYVARTFRPLPRLFAAAVRSSLATQSADPRQIRVKPKYEVTVWPKFGRMPMAKAETWSEYVKSKGFKSLYSLILHRLPFNMDQYDTPERAALEAGKILAVPGIVDKIDVKDLTAERLYQQCVVTGFAGDIKPLPDEPGVHVLDLSEMGKYQIQESSLPMGGRAGLDLTARKLLWVETPDGKRVKPHDKGFARAALEFRVTLFQYNTVVTHSVWCHGIVAPKFFLAVHEMVTAHPLQVFLSPFVLDVHKNVARSSFTVFGETGVVHVAGSFTDDGAEHIIDDAIKNFEVRLPTEYADQIPPEIRESVLQSWEAILDLVRDGMRALGVREDDRAVVRFHATLAGELSARLGKMPITEAIAYCIFTCSVAHHLWGHVEYGTEDSRFVSTRTRKPAHETDDLLQLAEPFDCLVLREGVIASTRRACVRLNTDLTPSTDDTRLSAVYSAFARRMAEIESKSPAMIDLQQCSVSTQT